MQHHSNKRKRGCSPEPAETEGPSFKRFKTTTTTLVEGDKYRDSSAGFRSCAKKNSSDADISDVLFLFIEPLFSYLVDFYASREVKNPNGDLIFVKALIDITRLSSVNKRAYYSGPNLPEYWYALHHACCDKKETLNLGKSFGLGLSFRSEYVRIDPDRNSSVSFLKKNLLDMVLGKLDDLDGIRDSVVIYSEKYTKNTMSSLSSVLKPEYIMVSICEDPNDKKKFCVKRASPEDKIGNVVIMHSRCYDLMRETTDRCNLKDYLLGGCDSWVHDQFSLSLRST